MTHVSCRAKTQCVSISDWITPAAADPREESCVARVHTKLEAGREGCIVDGWLALATVRVDLLHLTHPPRHARLAWQGPGDYYPD